MKFCGLDLATQQSRQFRGATKLSKTARSTTMRPLDGRNHRSQAEREREREQFSREVRTISGAVECGDLDRFDRCESAVHKKLYLTLIPEPRQNVSVTGGVRTGER
jgi:hypothetical protein